MNARFVQTDHLRRGFTITELIVVIGVIAVLAGILLAAMGGVRRKAMSTRTESTMTEFSKACDTFQLEHGRYPGVIPEDVLADTDVPKLSGTENALLDLMGGARVSSPTFTDADFGILVGEVIDLGAGWTLKVNLDLMGAGPLINGTPYAPYFTPQDSVLVAMKSDGDSAPYPFGRQAGAPVLVRQIPELMDAWGQPIVFVRRARPSGPLAALGPISTSEVRPQFYMNSMKPYTTSMKLGEFGKDQNVLSILNTAPDENATFAQILRHPSLGSFGDALKAQAGTARGAYILISAGPDGIYFSRQDGPGTLQVPIDDIIEGNPDYQNPTIVKEYDDIRIFGGG